MGIHKAIALALFLAALTGCATTTTIVTEPPGALVEHNGQQLGPTPLTYQSKMWMWETELVNVTSASGATKQIALKRSEIDVAPFVGSLGLVCCFGTAIVGLAGIPLFFAAAYKFPATTTVTFDQRPAAIPPSGPPLALASRKSRAGVVY